MIKNNYPLPRVKVAVSQRFLPHYRLEFYNLLYAKLGSSNVDVKLFYGYPLGPIEKPVWAEQIYGIKKRLSLGELEDYAVVSVSLLYRLIRYRPDFIIVEDLAGLPNSLICSVYCRLFRIPYMVWGLGNVPGKSRSRLRKYLAILIDFLYSGSRGFICYSKHAQSIYEILGKPTFVAPNSCLPAPDIEHVRNVVSNLNVKYQSPRLKILTIGELKKQKKFDELIIGFSRLENCNIELHIIGDGSERINLELLSSQFGVADRVIFHGAIYNSERKKELISASSLGVLPGRGGLVIQELMNYGLPVISGLADGTEQDNIIHGVNGYLLCEGARSNEIFEAIDQFLVLSKEKKVEMAISAINCVLRQYNIESMVEGVCNAVNYATRRSSTILNHL